MHEQLEQVERKIMEKIATFWGFEPLTSPLKLAKSNETTHKGYESCLTQFNFQSLYSHSLPFE